MIICHDLKKVYPGKNGNPDKHAVKGLSLALGKGQCFGMLGPNGAGKTSFINMVSNNSCCSGICFCCDVRLVLTQSTLCFLRNRVMLCVLTNRVILCF